MIVIALLPGCGGQPPVRPAGGTALRVLAAETFLADIAQNVAGDRLKVEALLPYDLDPHNYEPSPGDMAKIAQANVLIVNGAGFEAFLEKLLQNVGGERRLVEASAGLAGRKPREGEMAAPGEGDPHFWLDPTRTVRYVENIRDGLSQADPAGAAAYAQNARAYVTQLQELDVWIAAQVQAVPPQRRLLVTNHESLGYFADRYGFKIVGTIMPSVSAGAAPSAQQLAQLVERVRASGAPAVFLETGSNPQLAQQLAQETKTKVAAQLYTHSTTKPGGPAPTYIDMMKHNTRAIVEALQ